MAILLSLETSTGICSVALHEDGILLASSEIHVAHAASSGLAVMIKNLLDVCNLTAESLSGVAVASGPGSYTGLRIGVATAKGICFALNIPLIAINTLEVMTSQVIKMSMPLRVKGEEIFLCAMLDARRMEVYCMVTDRSAKVVESTNAKVIDTNSFEEWLKQGKVLFFGNGSDKCKEIINDHNAIFLGEVVPDARELGVLAFNKFARSEWEVLSSFEPYYLKDFVVKKPKAQI